jgi:UDP-N-acetylglucosamine acyltransferase
MSSASTIHPTAIIDPSAQLGDGVEIGPYCVIGAGVEFGSRCRLHAHVVVNGPCVIGDNNEFYPYACIGQRTQDLKYQGEPTGLEIGHGNTFREFCTIHRATAPGGRTIIGNHGHFLAYCHVAHDCHVGDHVIFSNNGTLAGHVTVEDHAILGGLTAVHQFCRIGRHAITGGCSKVVQDIPPFVIADGNPAVPRSVNRVGLERNHFPPEEIRAIRDAYKTLYLRGLLLEEALLRLEAAEGPGAEHLRHLARFVRASQRGIIR